MTQTQTGSDEAAAEAWKTVITKAMSNAITGLSGMLGEPIKVTSLGSRRVPVGEMPDLVGGQFPHNFNVSNPIAVPYTRPSS